MDLGLKGARVLVTGSTRGIGRAIAETFAAEGANVGICSRNQADVDSAVAALKAKGVAAFGGAVDVSDGAALKGWVERHGVEARRHRCRRRQCQRAVHRAGRGELGEGILHGHDGNGAAGECRDAVSGEKQAAAAIVTISSVSGREVDFASGPYGTFKAAIIHYTQGLAYQLASKGIRANSVSPGNTYFEGGVWNMIKDNNPELYKTALALNPTGRMGTPQEMANGAVFLASRAASFITGTNLVVDGALTRGVQF